MVKRYLVVTLALVLPGLLGYALAAPSIVVSPVALVTDGEGGFEELKGPKGIATVTIGPSTYALVAAYEDDGFQVIDITDPYSPSPVAAATDGEGGFEELDGARYVTTVVIDSSTYALVSASSDNGIQIINMTVPSSPVAVAHMSDAPGFYIRDPRGIATAVIGSSTYAVVAVHSGLAHIIDITDPSSPSPVAAVSDGSRFALSGARGVATATIGASTYALVAAHNDNAVQIINITDPYSPSPVATVHDSQDGMLRGATGITTATIGSSTYALVAAQRDNAVQIINITDPSSPDLVAFAQDGSDGFDRLRYPEDIAVTTFGSSTYAIVAAFLDGIQIINITDPSSPSPAASVDSNDARFGGFPLPESIAVATIDSRTYALAASYAGNSVPIIDVALTSGPVLTSAALDEGEGILRIEFLDAVDVTPAGMVDLSGLTIRDSGQSVSLAGATLGTGADSVAISVELTENQGRSVAAMASPRLDVADSAVTGTDGNPIERSPGNAITVNDDAAPEVVSAVFDGEGSILTITFSDRIDVTPASMVYLRGMTVSGSGQSVSLAGATLGTEADSAAISVELTESQGSSVAAMASPLLAMGRYDVMDTDGNPIESFSGKAITTVIADTTAPTITSIERSDPAEEAASVQTLVFSVTFSENVTGVDRADFVLSPGSTGTGNVTGVTGSDSQYLVTVSAAQDGTYNLDVAPGNDIADGADNSLSGINPAGADHTYAVSIIPADTTSPTITSIERSDPAEEAASVQTLVFSVTFSENVTGVDRADFVLSPGSTGTGNVTGVTGSDSQYLVTVSAAQDGTYNLDVAPGNGIADGADNSLSGINPAGADHTYAVSIIPADTTAPTITSIERSDPAEEAALVQTLVFSVTFSENVTGVDRADFVLSPGSTGIGNVTGVTGSDSQYLVTVSAAQDGTYNLDVAPGNDIADGADNSLSGINPAGADHTYAVSIIPADATAPTITSIERSDPTEEAASVQTLVFSVTFSENVTGVDRADFVLSQDSTGTGNVTGVTGSDSQYLVTVSAAQDGTYNLDVAPGNDIADGADNSLSGTIPTGEDQPYTVHTSVVRDDSANTLPSINAGPNQTVLEGSTVTLSGTASDPDGNTLTYSWGHDSALAIEFANSTSHATTFTAPWVGSNSTVTLTLTADDGTGSVSDSMSVTIVNAAQPPRNIGGISLSSTESGVMDAVWDAPGEAPIDYRISWAKTGESFRTWTDITGNAFPTGASHTIPNLEEGEEYTVKVRARYGGSSGPWSDAYTVTVAGTAPDQPANNPPVADTGDSQTILEGSIVTLNGTASDLDPEDSLAYSWSHNSTLAISLDDSAALDTFFTAPNVGSDTAVEFTLTVSDGTAPVSDKVIVTITDRANVAPTVSAGSDQAAAEGSMVTLNGTAFDADPEDSLAYSWSHNSTLAISLDDSAALDTFFTAPNVGSDTAVEFTLTVSDGTAPVSDKVIITITDSPAQVSQSDPRGVYRLTLSSTESGVIEAIWDAPGNSPADYRISWAKTGESFRTWTDLTGNAFPTGTSHTISGLEEGEEYTVKVRARYGGSSGPWSDAYTVTVAGTAPDQPANNPPVADTGDSQTILEGSIVTLNGTASDLDPEDSLAYSWSHNSTLAISLDDSAALDTFFTAPNVGSDTAVEFTLTVSDGTAPVSDKVIVTITDRANVAPTVSAGSDQAAAEGSMVTLNGTAFDADPEDSLAYSWSHNSTLAISLDDSAALDTFFTAPNVGSDTAVEFTLTVSDGTAPVSDKVIVTITDRANVAPTVSAGSDQAAAEGSMVTLNGTAFDADPEDSLAYSWSHNSTLAISLDDSAALDTFFTAPNVGSDTAVEFTLTVSDGTAPVSDKVIITITDSPAQVSQSDPRGVYRLTLSSTESGVIEAIWDAPGNSPADYRISWAKTGESFRTWTDLTGNAFPTGTSHTISGLEEGEEYTVKVRARYDGTAGDWSDGVTVTVAGTG